MLTPGVNVIDKRQNKLQHLSLESLSSPSPPQWSTLQVLPSKVGSSPYLKCWTGLESFTEDERCSLFFLVNEEKEL